MRFVELPRPFGQRAGAQPLPVPLGDDRSLERDVCHGEGVVDSLGELERALDVFACRGEVALSARTPRTPFQNVRAQPVTRETRAVGQVERLAQQRLRRVDRRELVTAHAHVVEDVGALHVGERVLLGQLACARQQVERRTQLAQVHAGPALRQACAELELLSLGRVLQTRQGFERLVETLSLDRCLRADDCRLGLRVLVPALPGLEVRHVDAEPLCNPGERLLGWTRLAAFDLTYVLLREPIAGQLRLRQTRGDAKLA